MKGISLVSLVFVSVGVGACSISDPVSSFAGTVYVANDFIVPPGSYELDIAFGEAGITRGNAVGLKFLIHDWAGEKQTVTHDAFPRSFEIQDMGTAFQGQGSAWLDLDRDQIVTDGDGLDLIEINQNDFINNSIDGLSFTLQVVN